MVMICIAVFAGFLLLWGAYVTYINRPGYRGGRPDSRWHED